MTIQPGLAPVIAKAGRALRQLSVLAVVIACCLVFGQCSWLIPTTSPTAGPTSSATSPQSRTITDANLIKAKDLPAPIGGGKVIEYRHNARTLDQLSICQPQPLQTLGASAIKSRSFQDRYSRGNQPFPHSSLDDQPDSYAVVLQFSDAAAAQRAKIIYDSWLTSCEGGNDLPAGIRALRSNISWTPVAADPAQAEVAEVAYRQDGSSGRHAYFESVGLTVLDDRMMITVHLFYTDESPYSLDMGEEEAGFAHPQLGLVQAAAKRLSE
ncbi:MAG TPA: hypothetical protein VI074_11580 [Propionibacteriaceae bacterium]